jgi:hypothetical protein
MILPITDFEITTQFVSDNFSYIKLYINKSNFITIPFQTSSIQKEITDKLIAFITQQKDVVINLSSSSSHDSRLFQIKKDYFLIDFLYRESSSPSLTQETYLICENNSIFRNAIRKFINDSYYFTKPGQS